jgi:excisionase family DNA binding protein
VDKRLLKIGELSAYLETPVATIYMWTHQKKIPHLKMGRAVRFDLRDIDGWLKEKRVSAISGNKTEA